MTSGSSPPICSAESFCRNEASTSESIALIWSSVTLSRISVSIEARAFGSISLTCSGVRFADRLSNKAESVCASRRAAAAANSSLSCSFSASSIAARSSPLSSRFSSFSVVIRSLSSMAASHAPRSSSGTSFRIFLSSAASSSGLFMAA